MKGPSSILSIGSAKSRVSAGETKAHLECKYSTRESGSGCDRKHPRRSRPDKRTQNDCELRTRAVGAIFGISHLMQTLIKVPHWAVAPNRKGAHVKHAADTTAAAQGGAPASELPTIAINGATSAEVEEPERRQMERRLRDTCLPRMKTLGEFVRCDRFVTR